MEANEPLITRIQAITDEQDAAINMQKELKEQLDSYTTAKHHVAASVARFGEVFKKLRSAKGQRRSPYAGLSGSERRARISWS